MTTSNDRAEIMARMAEMMKPRPVNYVAVEEIDISLEQTNPETWFRVYPCDGSGQWLEGGTMRYINWIDGSDDDEYPRQYGQWYRRGTLIPLEG